ncbi:alpha/beta hydrolase [Geminocystis sp. CENA526]|uniref:alpha/beta hydrolase n=1 Tax=Geminocystis sp. CENA526 TaxID=1355871 RepID=UPI003D6E3885
MKKSAFLLSLNIVFLCFFPNSGKSAETINLVHSSLIFSVSIESLETFAKTGELKGDLQQYSSSLDEKTLIEIRNFLNKTHDIDSVIVSKLSRTSLAEDLLKQLGKVVSTHRDRNGFYALRGAVVTTATQQNSWTILDVLRNFPSSSIFVNLELLAQLKDDLFLYQSYRDAVAKSIEIRANNDKQLHSNIDLNTLKNLSQKGEYQVSKETITIEKQDLRQTDKGFVREYSFDVDVYFPQNTSEKKPLILISHGFGSLKENFVNLAQHLASHGFVIAIPEHIGSNLQYREELLKGSLNSALSPVEFIARPQDMSSVIDKLQELTAKSEIWQKRVDLNKIGVIGDSLGGTTVLSLAGAPLNISRLQTECRQDQVIVNTAVILQCQGSHLPPVEYNLQDSRIKAVIATHPLTSAIFGPESLSKIKIPIMITAGGDDVITPVVIEQVHPFIWLQNPFKHLLFYQPGTHFSSTQPSPQYTLTNLPEILVGQHRDITSQYFHGIAVAFMEAYLNNNSQYLAYLTPNYGEFSSHEKLNVYQINDLTADDITSVFGSNLPLKIVPPLVISFPLVDNYNSIVDEIKNTGNLKVAYSQNTPPFGFINQDGYWEGYCSFLAEELASHLEEQLDLSFKPNIVLFPSNLTNRFDLVTNGQVHLECGANSMSQNLDDISFSIPFFVTGNYFLIPKTLEKNFNPNHSLQNFKIGVLNNTPTADLLKEKYPQAQPIYFNEGIEEEIKALEKGSIDAIFDSKILLENQVSSLKNPQDYSIVPSLPINCEYYGLLLPKQDSQWIEIVNNFLNKKPLTKEYFSPEVEDNLAKTLNYCLNINR